MSLNIVEKDKQARQTKITIESDVVSELTTAKARQLALENSDLLRPGISDQSGPFAVKQDGEALTEEEILKPFHGPLSYRNVITVIETAL